MFDVLILAGREVMHEPLSVRRELLQREIMPKLRDPVRESAILDASLPDLITAVKAQGLEGLVAKRRDSAPATLVSLPACPDEPDLHFLHCSKR